MFLANISLKFYSLREFKRRVKYRSDKVGISLYRQKKRRLVIIYEIFSFSVVSGFVVSPRVFAHTNAMPVLTPYNYQS